MQEALLTITLSLIVLVIHDVAMWLVTRLGQPLRMFTVMLILALAHTVHIWIYAAGLYVGVHWLHLGEIIGTVPPSHFLDYVYFSATNYTSLGYGDLTATGALRLPATFECLIGLLTIGWSTAFAFWWMQKHWLREGVRTKIDT